jgi:hypothetical protein
MALAVEVPEAGKIGKSTALVPGKFVTDGSFANPVRQIGCGPVRPTIRRMPVIFLIMSKTTQMTEHI